MDHPELAMETICMPSRSGVEMHMSAAYLRAPSAFRFRLRHLTVVTVERFSTALIPARRSRSLSRHISRKR